MLRMFVLKHPTKHIEDGDGGEISIGSQALAAPRDHLLINPERSYDQVHDAWTSGMANEKLKVSCAQTVTLEKGVNGWKAFFQASEQCTIGREMISQMIIGVAHVF